jgi:hypothetical protein
MDRRTFIVASTAACLCAGRARAQLKKAEENEPKAVAVGYRHDSGTVDGSRYPKHQPQQNCEGCLAFYPSDDETDEWGECDLMSDRLVHKKGWCSSFKPLKT